MGFDLEQLAEVQKYGRLLGHKEKRMLKKTKPKITQTPTKQKRGSYGYNCRKCGEHFQHLWQLSQHSANTHGTGRRPLGINGLQFTVPTNITKLHWDRKVHRPKNGSFIAASHLIPKDWQYIRIHAPIEKDGGLWVFIEPLEVEKT